MANKKLCGEKGGETSKEGKNTDQCIQIHISLSLPRTNFALKFSQMFRPEGAGCGWWVPGGYRGLQGGGWLWKSRRHRETNIFKLEDTPPNSILYKIQEEERFAVPLTLLQLQEFPPLTRTFLSSHPATEQENKEVQKKKKERKKISNQYVLR